MHNFLTVEADAKEGSLFPRWFNEYRDKICNLLVVDRDSSSWRDLQGQFFSKLDTHIGTMLTWAKSIDASCPEYLVWNALHYRPAYLVDKDKFTRLAKGNVDYCSTFFTILSDGKAFVLTFSRLMHSWQPHRCHSLWLRPVRKPSNPSSQPLPRVAREKRSRSTEALGLKQIGAYNWARTLVKNESHKRRRSIQTNDPIFNH